MIDGKQKPAAKQSFYRQITRIVKGAIQTSLRPFGLQVRRIEHDPKVIYPEATERQLELIERFRAHTMTGSHRQWNLLRAAEYVEQNAIPGDIVECGVWRGGNMMMLKAYLSAGLSRQFFLYDTFSGMAEPTSADRHFHGADAREEYAARKRDDHTHWAYASLADVKRNFEEFGLLDESVILVQGMVETTLRGSQLPSEIALLRLDTDWYESTKVEFEVLYPRLVSGGVLIIDDYGDWLGSMKATNEFFGNQAPLLIPVDHGCRMAVKP